MTAAIPDLVAFLLFKDMVAFGRKQYKPVSVPEVLKVGEAPAFAIRLLSFVDVDAVFRNQLLIKLRRIFAELDSASDVEPVTMSQIAHGDLLNKPFRRCCHTPVLVPVISAVCIGASDRCDTGRLDRLSGTNLMQSSFKGLQLPSEQEHHSRQS